MRVVDDEGRDICYCEILFVLSFFLVFCISVGVGMCTFVSRVLVPEVPLARLFELKRIRRMSVLARRD